MGRRRKAIEDDNDLIEQKARSGLFTLQEIGDQHGISREYVRQILMKRGINIKLHRIHEQDLPRVCKGCGAMYQRGAYREHLDAVGGSHRFARLGRRNLHPGRSQAIAADYQAGMKWEEIRRKYRVSAPTVRLALIEHGVARDRQRGGPLPTRAASREREMAILSEVDLGLTLREVADRHGCSPALVGVIRKKHGVDR